MTTTVSGSLVVDPTAYEDGLVEIGERLQRRAGLAGRQGAPTSAVTALRRLGSALGEGGTRLAGVDLVQAYPPEILMPEPADRASSGAARVVEVVRDLLVFVPVAFTWWHLQNALSAYEDAPSGTTFLLGWQRGFGGTVWPLGWIALVVALTVAAVIVLTGVAHALARRSAADRRYAEEQRALAGDLVLATVLLAEQDHTQVDRLPIRELSKLGSRVASASNAMVNALEVTRNDIVKAVDTGPGSALSEALSTWTSAAHELTETSRSLETPKKTLETLIELHRQVAEDGRRLHTGLENLVTGLDRGAKAQVGEAHGNRMVAAEVTRSIESLGNSLDAFIAHTEQLSELVLSLRHALDRLDQGYDGWGPAHGDVSNLEPPLDQMGPR